MVRSPLSTTSLTMMKLLLLHKSNPFLCPPRRPLLPGRAQPTPSTFPLTHLELSPLIFHNPFFNPSPTRTITKPHPHPNIPLNPSNPPPPPLPNQHTPPFISDSSQSLQPFAHITHCIFFHTDFLVQSYLPISTSHLNPNTHSLKSIDLSPSPTSLFLHLPLPQSSLKFQTHIA